MKVSYWERNLAGPRKLRELFWEEKNNCVWDQWRNYIPVTKRYSSQELLTDYRNKHLLYVWLKIYITASFETYGACWWLPECLWCMVAKVFRLVLSHGSLVNLWYFFKSPGVKCKFFGTCKWLSEYHDMSSAIREGLWVKDVESDEMCVTVQWKFTGITDPLSHSLQGTMPVSVLCALLRGHSFPLQPFLLSLILALSVILYLTDQTLGLSIFELCNVFFCLCRH